MEGRFRSEILLTNGLSHAHAGLSVAYIVPTGHESAGR